jgi:hypothetical protein
MISQKLQNTFSMMETATYPEYEKADKIGRDKICRELAKVEAKMIMDEIHAEVERRMKT